MTRRRRQQKQSALILTSSRRCTARLSQRRSPNLFLSRRCGRYRRTFRRWSRWQTYQGSFPSCRTCRARHRRRNIRRHRIGSHSRCSRFDSDYRNPDGHSLGNNAIDVAPQLSGSVHLCGMIARIVAAIRQTASRPIFCRTKFFIGAEFIDSV